MYNNMYSNPYNTQASLDRINSQINELQKIRDGLQQPMQPTNLTQNFQLAPSNRDVIRYANSLEEVQRDAVLGETPYFSKDMSVVWIKNIKGDIKTYELNEIIPKDDKDIKIEMLMAQINELKKEINNEHIADINEPVEDEKPTSISTISKPTKKSKQSTRFFETND